VFNASSLPATMARSICVTVRCCSGMTPLI